MHLCSTGKHSRMWQKYIVHETTISIYLRFVVNLGAQKSLEILWTNSTSSRRSKDACMNKHSRTIDTIPSSRNRGQQRHPWLRLRNGQYGQSVEVSGTPYLETLQRCTTIIRRGRIHLIPILSLGLDKYEGRFNPRHISRIVLL